jgi:Ca-activated chloride channel family protein
VAFLAWARDEALRAGKKDEAERLQARARRLGAANAKAQANAQGDEKSVRVLVTWAHPELHPSLWTTTLGAPMPSPDNFPAFGVAEAKALGAPATVELRLDVEDAARAARLGLAATVTVIVGAGTPAEKIVRQEVGFGTAAAPVTRLSVTYDGGALRLEQPKGAQ